jgi:hypothetical protein
VPFHFAWHRFHALEALHPPVFQCHDRLTAFIRRLKPNGNYLNHPLQQLTFLHIRTIFRTEVYDFRKQYVLSGTFSGDGICSISGRK